LKPFHFKNYSLCLLKGLGDMLLPAAVAFFHDKTNWHKWTSCQLYMKTFSIAYLNFCAKSSCCLLAAVEFFHVCTVYFLFMFARSIFSFHFFILARCSNCILRYYIFSMHFCPENLVWFLELIHFVVSWNLSDLIFLN